jgi:DNA (cytosine-5)-methyltransferase 1
MVLRVDESDPRCPFVAGMEDIPIDEVLRPRECVLTNRSYPRLSFRDGPRCAYPASFSDKEIKHQVFHGGRLACRVVNILINKNKAKPHAGIIRHLYAIEADSPKQGPGTSRAESIALDDDDHDEGFIIVDSDNDTRSSNSGAHSNSAEHASTRHQPQMPAQNRRYIFGDVFCGAGGASQGARQAGLQVMWGLDNDDDAIKAYQSNYPGALPFRCNAHNFPPRGHSNEELNVDILHLSPPCCFFSPAHTREGPNDQANLEAIYTVGPILDKVKPRVATLEQTSGLSTFAQHKANFLMLLHDIGRAGYDVRYVNQDLSEFGLVQKRKRLLIIAAR